MSYMYISNALASSHPGVNGDYMNLHGGRGCYDPIHPNSVDDDTKLDLRWVRDKAGKVASEILLSCKLLLRCIRDGVEHPLDHALIARMTPNYPKDVVAKFSLATDIAIPNEALTQFGIDIFADHNYDTWVLFTITARAHNNSCGDPTADLISPLFSLFNHSCSPNVNWSIADDHQSVTLQLQKSVSKDEQLFVRYDGYIDDLPLNERRESMWRWLDGPCQCERCVAEERSFLLDGASICEKPFWDPEEKPVFPEDLLNLKN